ncbi:class I SAM-dependent rRNA methyltransferase [Granulicella paludicola]|uniref:class I SAM-dependent rRNA methyltransferase n=1 Tax=Granulicella paludicola TaxID=474951 RepID=UPI0021E0E02D|nr:class I SAM-dependent rRNA methyltransferase [Granulicella paludicola]
MSTLRITLRAADRLRAGHLWIYRSDVESKTDGLEAGSLVTISDRRELPLGTALYSNASQIAGRLVSHTPALTREQYLADLRQRIDAAIALRQAVAPNTTAHRLIFSEADNLPGIIADRYNDLVLAQLLTQGTAQDDVRKVLVEALRAGLAPNGEPLTIWERPDPRIRELEQLPAPSSEPLFASNELAPTTTTFTLNDLHFQYDAASGQKTGAFLDQRLNYAAAARIVAASGRTEKALDICTYQGGFALHLAKICSSVTGVDASRSALEAADRNLLLNPELAARCETDWVEADAFEYLRHLDDIAQKSNAEADRFDAIVLDPPAFAKSKRATEGALRGYKELNLRAMRLLNPGGTLITNSCSHHVSLEEFTAIVAAAATDAGRRVQLLETHAAAPDHPEILTLPETRYLKCLICRVD